ncbi:MAG: divalent metal cation transporter [Treponema sp.]|jgi:Mn2+/Fe2+ NRAMP family transporter|nr:divalent metal cation transporter [Treponema sp.]
MSDESRVKKNVFSTVGLGAAFLMALSAVGPGFLTQTAVFTQTHKTSFAFAILVVIIVDIIGQLNVWRIMGVSAMRGQDIANKVLRGSGYFLAFLVALGGLAFNIGNVGGSSLGLQALFGLDESWSILTVGVSGLIGAILFLSKNMLRTVDKFVKVLGVVVIAVIGIVMFQTAPPYAEVVAKTFVPDSYSALGMPILTLIGGTIGGYIIFSGGHRIIDAGMTGRENLGNINKSAVTGIVICSIVRILLFLAILGVVAKGGVLDPKNPAPSAFRLGAGEIGYRFFGIVMWAAGATSIVGAAYTSVSFLKTLFPVVKNYEKFFIIGFIVVSTAIMMILGGAAKLLVLAGSLNGLILPLSLGLILFGAFKKEIVGNYKHPLVLTILGFIVVIATAYTGITSLRNIANLFG